MQVAFETCGVSVLAPATSDPSTVQQRWSPKASLQQELIGMTPHGSSWDGFLTQLTLFHSSPHSSGQPFVFFIHSLIRLFAYIIKRYRAGSHTFSVPEAESRPSWDRTELQMVFATAFACLFLHDSYVLRVVLLGDSGGPQQVWGTRPFLLFLFLVVCDVIIITHTPAMI